MDISVVTALTGSVLKRTERIFVATSGIVKNSFFILLSRGIQIASSFFVVIVVARYLSVDQYGEYSYIIAFVSSIMALAYFGIQQLLIREIANDKDGAAHVLGAAVELRTILSTIAILALGVSVYAMKLKGVLLAAAGIAVLSEFFLSFSMLAKSVFQAFEKMHYEPFISLMTGIVQLLGVGAVIYFDLGFLWLFAAAALANLTQLLLSSSILSRNFVRPVFTTDRQIFRRFLKDSVVIGVGIFFYQNLFRINVLMLKWLGSNNDVSFFQIPHSIIMQLQVVPMSVAMAVFPVFSRLLVTDKERMVLLFEKICRFMLIGSLFCGLSISLFSRELITLMFGIKYDHSIAALVVVAWAIIPLTMDMLLNGVLIAMHKQKYSVLYAGATLTLNALFSVIFIPRYGYMAAAWISVCSYLFLFLCSLYFLQRNGIPSVMSRSWTKMLFATLVSGSVMFALKPFSLVAAACSGFLFFFGIIVGLRVVAWNEVVLIKGMIRTIPGTRRPQE